MRLQKTVIGHLSGLVGLAVLATAHPAKAEEAPARTLGDLSPSALAREFESMPDDDRDYSELSPAELQILSGNPGELFFAPPGSPQSPVKSGVPLFPAEWPTQNVKNVTIYVDKDEDSRAPQQRLKLKVNGAIVPNGSWPVSSGIPPAHRTPDFQNRPVLKMVYDYWSHKYNAPMNWSVFITEGIALHATPERNYPHLGHPASHGCIRQTETRAYWLYNYIKKFRALTHIYVL